MTNKYLLVLVLLISSFTLFSQTYITNVTIADVEKQILVPNQPIVITNDLISNIHSSKKIKFLPNATVIDETNKYIVPGLTGSHIHFFQNN